MLTPSQVINHPPSRLRCPGTSGGKSGREWRRLENFGGVHCRSWQWRLARLPTSFRRRRAVWRRRRRRLKSPVLPRESAWTPSTRAIWSATTSTRRARATTSSDACRTRSRRRRGAFSTVRGVAVCLRGRPSVCREPCSSPGAQVVSGMSGSCAHRLEAESSRGGQKTDHPALLAQPGRMQHDTVVYRIHQATLPILHMRQRRDDQYLRQVRRDSPVQNHLEAIDNELRLDVLTDVTDQLREHRRVNACGGRIVTD